MLHVIVLAVGVALGILFAYSTVPRVFLVPTIATTVLTVAAAGALVWLDRASGIDGFILVVAVLAAGILTSGAIWYHRAPDRTISYWTWVSLTFRAPSRLRAAYGGTGRTETVRETEQTR